MLVLTQAGRQGTVAGQRVTTVTGGRPVCRITKQDALRLVKRGGGNDKRQLKS